MTSVFKPLAQKARRKLLRMTAPERLFTGHILVNEAQKCVYLAIPKCANSSLKSAFLNNCDVQLTPELLAANPQDPTLGTPLKDPNVVAYLQGKKRLIHRNDVLSRYASFERVVVLRDPATRAYSCWKDKISPENVTNKRFVEGRTRGLLRYGDAFWPGMSFAEFLTAIQAIPDKDSNGHFRSQLDFFHDDSGRCLANRYMFVETLNDDLSHASAPIRACFDGLGHKNIKGGKSKRAEWTEAERAALAQRYRRDYDFMSNLDAVPFPLLR